MVPGQRPIGTCCRCRAGFPLLTTVLDPIVVEALLAHKQQGVAAVYNRASFRDAKRKALMGWHTVLVDEIGCKTD